MLLKIIIEHCLPWRRLQVRRHDLTFVNNCAHKTGGAGMNINKTCFFAAYFEVAVSNTTDFYLTRKWQSPSWRILKVLLLLLKVLFLLMALHVSIHCLSLYGPLSSAGRTQGNYGEGGDTAQLHTTPLPIQVFHWLAWPTDIYACHFSAQERFSEWSDQLQQPRRLPHSRTKPAHREIRSYLELGWIECALRVFKVGSRWGIVYERIQVLP